MLIVVSYDIESDRTRTHLANKLKDFGPRVQFSVFEADVNENELQRLYQKLANVKLGKADSIRLYRVCGECAKSIKIWGVGVVTKDRDYYIA